MKSIKVAVLILVLLQVVGCSKKPIHEDAKKQNYENNQLLYGYDDTPEITNEEVGKPVDSWEWGNKRSPEQILKYNDSNYPLQPVDREKIKVIRRENYFPEVATFPARGHEWYRVKDSSVIGCKKGIDSLLYLYSPLPTDDQKIIKKDGGCEAVSRPGRFKVTRFESHEVSGESYVDFARVQVVKKLTKEPFNIEFVDYKGNGDDNATYSETIYYVWRNEIELAE